jgi:tetratricopeptide (TPR) repeat protein
MHHSNDFGINSCRKKEIPQNHQDFIVLGKKEMFRMFHFAIVLMAGILLLAGCSQPTEQYLAEARAKLQAGKHREAISLLDEALKADGQLADAYNMRGVAYISLKEFPKAITNFDQAILINDRDYRYLYNRGNAKRALDMSKDAIEDYNLALALDSSQYEVYLNRALCYFQDNQWEKALDDFNRSAGISAGKDKNVFYYRGKLYFNAERFEDAQADFQKCIELEPGFAEGYHSLALAKIVIEGKSEESCELLKKSVELGFSKAQEMVDAYCK